MDVGSQWNTTANHTDVNLTGLTGQTLGEVLIPFEGIVSSHVKFWIEQMLGNYLLPLLAILGIFVNVVILIVFYRQGFKETINISLTAIAIWDFSKCLCGAVTAVSIPMRAAPPALELTYFAYSTLIAGYTSTFCTYVSSVLAGYVAVERCLCVTLPFTVKHILTPKVVTCVMIVLSILTFGSCSVMYPLHEIHEVFIPRYNAVISRLVYGEIYYKYPVLFQVYNAMGFLWPALSLSIQCVATIIIIRQLRMSSKFRSKSSAGNTETATEKTNTDVMSPRDRQVTKMLLLVISIYIVNMLPRLTLAVAKSVVPGFYLFMRYHNLFSCCMWFEVLFDFVNATINPFVYYFMSSQYKEGILKLFGFRKKVLLDNEKNT